MASFHGNQEFIGVGGELSTAQEAVIAALNNLASGSATQAVRKVSASSFANLDIITSSIYLANETPVGAVDGSNTLFTVSNTPKFVIIDGMFRVAGFGYTYSAGLITVDATNAPILGGFILSFY